MARALRAQHEIRQERGIKVRRELGGGGRNRLKGSHGLWGNR